MSYSIVVVALSGLLVQLSLAHYSLYISEDKLQSYYAGSVYEELVQGQVVEIVKEGEPRVGDDGSLQLSSVANSLGSGSGFDDVSLFASPYEALPPLPAHVETVDFTWVKTATATVNYVLQVTQKGSQLFNPSFNVLATGEISPNPTVIQLSVSCKPLAIEVETVEVNLITSLTDTMFNATFYFRKSCNYTDGSAISTVYSYNFSTPSIPIITSSQPVLTPTPLQIFASSSRTPNSPLLILSSPSLSTSDLVLMMSVSPSLVRPFSIHSLSEALFPSSSFVFVLPLSQTPLNKVLPSHSLEPISSSTSIPSTSRLPTSSLSSLSISISQLPHSSPNSLQILPSSHSPQTSPILHSPSTAQMLPKVSTVHKPLSTFVTSTQSRVQTLLFTPLQSTKIKPAPSPFILQSTLFTPRASLYTTQLSHSTNISPTLLLSTPLPSFPTPPPSASEFSYHIDELSTQPMSTQFVIHKSNSILSSPMYFPSLSLSTELLDSLTFTSSGSVLGISSSVLIIIKNPSENESVSQLLLIVCGVVGGILLACILLICCILVCWKCRARGKKKIRTFSDYPLDVVHTVPYSPSMVDEDTKKKPPPPLSLWMGMPWGTVFSLSRSLQTLVGQIGVDRKSLSILDTIIRGEYGSVVSGQLNNVRADVMSGSQSVTIKMLTGFPDGSRRDEVVRFLEAATLMKGIQHPHILSVLRVSLEDNYVPLVIYPMVQHGDMHRVIKLAADPEHSVLPPLTTKLTLELAIQIATAMCYLADYSVVHPDLALRNCLLDSECTVKVADAALAQQFYPECYYTLFGATRPVRWAAVETLQEGLCTTRSNVWSYAVTIWEILTFAEIPYSEVNNNRSILSTIKMGARLPRPPTCPEPLYKLLCSCWNDRGEERPNFIALISRLQQLLFELQPHDTTDTSIQQQLSHSPLQRVKNRYSSNSMGKPVNRERLSHNSDSPRTRSHFTHRDMSQGSLNRVSTTSMMSRGSTAERLSVTFSVLSSADSMQSGNNSDEDTDIENGIELQVKTDDKELQSILHQVSTTFVESSVENTPPPPCAMEDDTSSSIITTTLSDISSHTLVPTSLSTPAKLLIETLSVTSSNPVSLTPPPSQAADNHSKTSTMDLESVSTAPYTSSPLQSTSFLYPTNNTNGCGMAISIERGEHSPLLLGHKAHAHSFLPSRPSVKSTDSGIRSDEDSHSPNEYVVEAHISSNVKTQTKGDEECKGAALSDLSSSFMAAFDSWNST